MKKLLIIGAALFIQSSGMAQTMEISAKGAIKGTGIFNQEISDAGDELDYKLPALGYSAGAGFSFFFTPSLGVGVELLTAQHVGKYQGVIGTVNYEAETKIKSIDVPILFKVQTKSGGSFLDLGIQYSMINKVTSSSTGSTESDDTKAYNSSNLAAVLGFGINIDLTQKLFLTTGLRFEYGLSDIISSNSLYDSYGDVNGDGKRSKTFTGAAGLNVGLMYRLGGGR